MGSLTWLFLHVTFWENCHRSLDMARELIPKGFGESGIHFALEPRLPGLKNIIEVSFSLLQPWRNCDAFSYGSRVLGIGSSCLFSLYPHQSLVTTTWLRPRYQVFASAFCLDSSPWLCPANRPLEMEPRCPALFPPPHPSGSDLVDFPIPGASVVSHSQQTDPVASWIMATTLPS